MAGTDDGRISSAPDERAPLYRLRVAYTHPKPTVTPPPSPGPSFFVLFSIARPGQCFLACSATCKDARNVAALGALWLPFENTIFESLFELER